MKLNQIIIIIVVIGLLAFFGYRTYSDYSDSKPERELPIYGPIKTNSKAGSEDKPTEYHQVPDFKFINQDGQEVSLKDFNNKIYVTDFFFTTCQGICPKMTKQMDRVVKAFEKEPTVVFLSHTVNPEYDSVAILKDYAKEFDAETSKWMFVTGDKRALYKQARDGYFLDDTKGDGSAEDFVHTENFALVDKERRIRGYYDGTDSSDVNRLIADLKVLLKYYKFEGR